MLRLAPTAFEEITFPDQPMFTDLTNCARKTALSETEGHAAITTLNRPWPRGVERSGGQLAEPNWQQIETSSASRGILFRFVERTIGNKDGAAIMKIAAQ